MNVRKNLRRYGMILASLLCAVSVAGCSTGWEDVIIVDEGRGGTMAVGLDAETSVFETQGEGVVEETEGQSAQAETQVTIPQELLQKLDISAQAYCILDADTDTVVAGYRPTAMYAPASIVKILTALIVAEQCPDLSATVEIERSDIDAIAMLSSTMEPMIREDEVLTIQDLLYGMLLESSNACAVVLARHVGGSQEAFAQMMNDRAVQIGATQSHFVNASGLDAEGQYVTARDMALIMREALRNPVTALALSTDSYTTSPTNFFGSRTLRMGHMMVNGDYPVEGVYAGKTGFTLNAGYTMVTAVRRGEHNLIVVTLGSSYGSNFSDMETVIEYGMSRISGTVYAAKPAAYRPRMVAMDETGFTLDCQVSTGAASVKYAVWSEAGGQDDLIWYDCLVDETTASVTVPLANHGGQTGRYQAACYVTDVAGNSAGITIHLLITGQNLQKGVVTYNGNAYYIEDDGRIAFGFIESEGGNYFADSEGRLQTGITGEEGCKTLAGADYKIIDGFGEWNGQTYYVQKSAQLMTGHCVIQGKGYLFSEQGVLQE